jgi:hypothetical protein
VSHWNIVQVLDRLRALEAVVHGVLMGETVRRRIETNIETRDVMRKQLWQEVQVRVLHGPSHLTRRDQHRDLLWTLRRYDCVTLPEAP